MAEPTTPRAVPCSAAACHQAWVSACGRGDLDGVRDALALEGEEAVDVHADGEAALHAACLGGHTEVMQLLLGLGGDRRIDLRQCGAATFTAACGSNIHAVRLLLSLEGDRRIDVRSACEDEHSSRGALEQACLLGRAGIVQELLALQGDRRIENDAVLFRACTCACDRGHAQVLAQLLSLGGDRYVESPWVLVDAAVQRNHAVVLRELLSLQDARRVDCLDAAAEQLVFACTTDRVDVVREMIRGGVDVNADDEEALRETCRRSEGTAVLQLLLGLCGDQCVDVHALDDSALKSVCLCHAADKAQLLLELPPERGLDWDSEEHQALLRAVYPVFDDVSGGVPELVSVLPFPRNWMQMLVHRAAHNRRPSDPAPPAQLEMAMPAPGTASARLAFCFFWSAARALKERRPCGLVLPGQDRLLHIIVLACVLPGLHNEGAKLQLLRTAALCAAACGSQAGVPQVPQCQLIASRDFGAMVRRAARDAAWRGACLPLMDPLFGESESKCGCLARVPRAHMVLFRAAQWALDPGLVLTCPGGTGAAKSTMPACTQRL